MQGTFTAEDTARLVLHELRAPLGLMATIARTMNETEESPHRSQVAAIQRTADRMLRIAETVIDMAQSGPSAEPAWVSVSGTLEDLATDVRAAEARPMVLELPEDETESYVYGVAAQCETLFHSLLVNALDHSRPETEIQLAVDPTPNGVLVTISNVADTPSVHRGQRLGLLFCGRLASDLGARLDTRQAGDRFAVTVWLPRRGVPVEQAQHGEPSSSPRSRKDATL